MWCDGEEVEARRGGSSLWGTGIAGSRRRGREMWQLREVASGYTSADLVCGSGASVDRGVVQRERERGRGEGERVMVFWLSHVSFISRFGPMEIVVRSSIGYLKPTEITVSFVGRLRLTEIVVPSSVGYLNLTEIIVSFIDQLRQKEVVVLSSVFREANGNYFSR
jgi:hypothetical protein